MRIDLNLALHQNTHERYALYWAVPVTLGALVAFAYLTGSTIHTLREYSRVRRSVAECRAQQEFLRERERAALRRLQQPQFQSVLREARYVNSLIDRRRLSFTTLTANLTRLLPADVRVTTLSLVQGAEDPVVRMTIESSSQEKIIAFVQNIEDSPNFSEPVISSEDPGQQGSEGAAGSAARMICTARYQGWRNSEDASGDESGDTNQPAVASPAAKNATGAPKTPAATRAESGGSKQKAASAKQEAASSRH